MAGFINSAYLLSSALAASASLSTKSLKTRAWWLMLSIGLCTLGMLRIAEAGVWADEYLRSGLHQIGWYDERRPIQVVCIAAFALVFLPAIRLIPVRVLPLSVAIIAFYVLWIFAAVRSSSLHWSDAILGEQVGRFSLSQATQSALLLVTSAAAAFECYCGVKNESANAE